MKEDNIVQLRAPGSFSEDPLTEVLRLGARQLLAHAVEAEVEQYFQKKRSVPAEFSSPTPGRPCNLMWFQTIA